ncbi:MAG: Glycine betaine/carnitine/choline transport system permease protein OpuCB [Calditrichaeota bacterium]|nr:Glycine betaine/carnitine/choline transport system permease protein OpuCB [Calditrichota bacterium]
MNRSGDGFKRFMLAVLIGILIYIIWYISAHSAPARDPVKLGSKKFTESVILGEIAALHLSEAGIPAEHLAELGGTRILFNALVSGEIDAYPEYTGTLREEIFRERSPTSSAQIRELLAERGVRITGELGFNNTYALGMLPDRADELGIGSISDLRGHPELEFGFTSEFLNRGDGWPSLRDAYDLPQRNVSGMDHDLAYRALANGAVDVIDLYSTDAEIAYYDLRVLADDRSHFPSYQAVYLYRNELSEETPGAVAALEELAGRFDADRMRALNRRVKIDGESEAAVAASFLEREFGAEVAYREETAASRLLARTGEHLVLVGIALALGILVAIPLGVFAYRSAAASPVILAAAGIIQTVPSLALLVFMIPLLGIAGPPAIAALFLYSLLPIVRNTHAGLAGIAPSLRESAEALGLTARDRLFHVELPLASPSILAGIKTSAVITIGFATLGALIGAGGYGQPILTGIRLDDYGLILEGAVPAAALAIVAQGLFDLLERVIVPRGLRLKRAN